jgi:NADH-quinone oxidoreductase subunit J
VLTADAFLFWFLAILTIGSAILVITKANPIFSALALAMTMVGVAALFVTLEAYFLAGVQLIVYAGAVMVLFVMVLMLFDLKHEARAFTRGLVSGAIKAASTAVLAGLVVGALVQTVSSEKVADETKIIATKDLGHLLMTQYLFGFEALGLLLLIVAVGAVALARSRGGTHAKS